MRKAALLDRLFPLKFSCMEHHSFNLDTGKTARCFESFVCVVDKGGTVEQTSLHTTYSVDKAR